MSNQAATKNLLTPLIDRYKKVKESGLFKQYDEANTCKDFILPLFELLGWNVYDRAEVTAQAQASKGKVDYAFCIQGIPKFFLEAKALKADLDNPRWAEQTINYAWHKGVVWAVLSDFEALKVFNTEWLTKSPQESLFFELKWTEYLDRFDQLYLLSKEAFLEGRLDKEAERWGKKKTKIPVNEKLLQDMMEWRQLLATSIRHSHPKLSEEELDEAIQRILDRLIFIRTCEDRGIEQPVLQPIVREWRSNLKKIFRNFDSGYNSQIFAPHLCEDLAIETEVLEKIINGLYETQDQSIRYDFSAIDADVLGSMYEQYLGHILKKTPKRATVHEKHQHRKEMGIYYTPKYIVDYIVKNTVGALLKEKSYREAVNLKILDPACGSGSFLIRAFEEMDCYLKEKRSQKGEEFDYFRRMEILNRNLYGVDLDKQAVEIAQLNLLIKALEARQCLPVLKNIRRGNSLISGSEEELEKDFGKDWLSKHPFYWKKEFPEVFKDGGFDVIIGNPPYVNLANIEDEKLRNFLKKEFTTAKNKSDLYSFFVERVVTLLKDGGRLGFIISNSWLGTDSFSKFREFLIKNVTVSLLVKLSAGIFEDAIVTPVLIFLKKEKAKQNFNINLLEYKDGSFKKFPYQLSYKRIIASPNFSFSFYPEIKFNISTIKLGSIAKFSLGIKTSNDERFISDGRKFTNSYRLLRGKDVCRYFYIYSGKWIWYKPDLMMQKVGAGPRKIENFLTEKILFRTITGGSIISTLDTEKHLTNDKVHILYSADKFSLKFILGVVNSNLIGLWIKSTFSDLLEIKINQLEQIPIPKIDFSKLPEKKLHDGLVKLVDKMLDLNKQLQKITPNTDRWSALKSEIEKTDKAIDQAVYDLYSITDEEKKIIEQTTQ